MPPPNPNAKRMTAQPLKPARHRAGKAEYEVASDSDSEEEEEETQKEIKPVPKPTATSFRPKAYQVVHIQKSLVAEREEKDRAARLAARAAELEVASDEEDEDEEESEGEEEESEAESDSSEDRRQARLKNFRPTFVKKGQRGKGNPEKSADDAWYEQEARKKQLAQEALEEQVERVKEEKRLGRVEWDDDAPNEVSMMRYQRFLRRQSLIYHRRISTILTMLTPNANIWSGSYEK